MTQDAGTTDRAEQDVAGTRNRLRFTAFSALLEVLRPVRGRLVVAMLLEGLGTVSLVVSLVSIVHVGRVLVDAGTDRDQRAVIGVVVAVVAYVVRVVLVVAAATVSHVADADFQLDLRRRVAAHLGRLPLGWFSRNDSGAVRKLAADDVSSLHIAVAHTLLDVVSAVVLPVAVFCYLVSVDPALAVLCLLPLAIGLFCYRLSMRGAGHLMPQFYAAFARINGAVTEFVRGISVVRTFGQAGRAHRSFRSATDDFDDFWKEWAERTIPQSAASVTALSVPASLLVAGVGGWWWLRQGWLEPMDLVAFLLLTSALTSSIFPIILSTQALRDAEVSAQALDGLLRTPPLPVPPVPSRTAGSTVRYEGVGFGYRPGSPVLREVDLVLEPGSVTAVVGRSGAGKSTLAALLPRFHDVTAGRITIGGADVRDLDPADLYRQVAFVFQDVALLRLSIADNIRLGRPDASAAMVEDAARRAAVHDRIATLPLGYDSVIGEDVVLSGGESQRVAIARALLADAPVLVLDEAASYADPDSEAQVQQALSALVQGRTILTIAHRLRSVSQADQIVVLDEGRVVERGRHDELVAAGGHYASLWASSTALEETGSGGGR